MALTGPYEDRACMQGWAAMGMMQPSDWLVSHYCLWLYGQRVSSWTSQVWYRCHTYVPSGRTDMDRSVWQV